MAKRKKPETLTSPRKRPDMGSASKPITGQSHPPITLSKSQIRRRQKSKKKKTMGKQIKELKAALEEAQRPRGTVTFNSIKESAMETGEAADTEPAEQQPGKEESLTSDTDGKSLIRTAMDVGSPTGEETMSVISEEPRIPDIKGTERRDSLHPDIISAAEKQVEAAVQSLDKKTHIRNVYRHPWVLYSRDFIQLCQKVQTTFSIEQLDTPALIIQKCNKTKDDQGRTQQLYNAGIWVREGQILGDTFVLPKYASAEAIRAPADTEAGERFHIELVFLGLGCLKIRMPTSILKKLFDKYEGETDQDGMIEFIGVQNTDVGVVD
jgi:hypothetical protein